MKNLDDMTASDTTCGTHLLGIGDPAIVADEGYTTSTKLSDSMDDHDMTCLIVDTSANVTNIEVTANAWSLPGITTFESKEAL